MAAEPRIPWGRFVERLRPANPTGMSKADRTPLKYRAFVPDRIADTEFVFSGSLATTMGEAERRIGALQGTAPPAGLEQLARQLLRAESVASSRIEGLVMSHKRISLALFDPGVADATAVSIVGNIRAMEEAVRIGSAGRAIGVDDLVEMHRALLSSTRDKYLAGVVRQEQNWIGASSLARAKFIPPPAEEVAGLLGDLCRFVNRLDVPPIAQAAIAHSQYETIHPHLDGNGRVGRCLIHVVLRRRGLTPRYVPPVSLVLATEADRYVAGLGEYRRGDFESWCDLFTSAAGAAAEHAVELGEQMAQAQQRWLERLPTRPRRDSATARLLDILPGHPVIDGATVAKLLDVSDEAARIALNNLEAAGILKESTSRRWGRAYAATEVFEMLDGFENTLATPAAAEAAVRPAPTVRRLL
ncbi:MAG: Fic family protein [Candidatus Dormibacteria bacterium]